MISFVVLLTMYFFILEIDEATVYDDGYNRKKSKKRKKKQNGDKEKKPKIESKSKKEANKFNVQGIVKVEVKNENDNISFEYVSQENIEEIPVPQGSYNDKIIIEDDPIDPLKIDDNPPDNFNPPEITDKYTKKKKKHSKHSEQKKLKPKHVSKSKRKRDNLSLSDHVPTSNISDATVQCKTADLSIYDINVSKISKNINILPGDINILPVVSISNELNKRNINKTNINLIKSDLALKNNRKDTAKSSNITEDTTICSSINDRSDFSKMAFTNTDIGKNSCVVAQNTKSEFQIPSQNESTKYVAATQIKQPTSVNYKNMGTMSSENRLKNNSHKNLIKAPRLVLPNLPSIRIPKPQPEKQQLLSPTMPKIEMKEVIDTKNAQKIYFLSLPSSSHHKPPVLKNEMEMQCIGNNSEVKSPPSLEISMLQVPADTTITHVPNRDCTMFFNTPSQSYNYSTNFKSEIRTMGKTPCASDGSNELIINPIWMQNPYSTASKPVQAMNEPQDFITISNVSSVPKNTMFVSQSSTYPPAQIIPNIYMQNTDLSTSVLPAPALAPVPARNSKRAVPKVPKSSQARQKSQKGTSRRKPSAKSSKSNNDVSSNTSEASITSTSVGVQIDSSIDSTWSDLSDPNIQSRITNAQDVSHEYEDEYSDIPDNNKAQLQDLQKQKGNNSHLVASKVNKPSILKKPKEKKATTRRKQSVTRPTTIDPAIIAPAIIAPTTIASATIAPTIAISTTVAPTAVVSTTVTPATIASTTVAPETIASVDVAPATTAATVTPATVAPVTEAAKDQSTSKQSTDIPQLCSQPTPIIPGHISEMIYPNVPNSELLKAFNNYWSAQVSHCAICATFASCTSGNSRIMPPDWKYCESATLPESTPIWVRK